MHIPANFKDVYVLFSNVLKSQKVTMMTLSYLRESVIFSFGKKNKRVEIFNVAYIIPIETPYISSIRVVFRNGQFVVLVHEQYQEMLAALGAMQRLCNQPIQFIPGMKEALGFCGKCPGCTNQGDGAGSDAPVAGPSGNAGPVRPPSPSPETWGAYRMDGGSYECDETVTESDSE